MSRALTIFILFTAATWATGPIAAQDAADGQARADKRPKHRIHFTASVSNDRGQIACAIFRRDGWLKTAVVPAFSSIQNGKATCTFENVPPGEYAISAFHDENMNNELETNFLGIPTEDWCTSRNAKGVFGPPSFDDAKFSYDGGEAHYYCRM